MDEKGSKQVDVLDVQPAAAASEQIAAAVFEWQLGLHKTMLARFLPPIKISVEVPLCNVCANDMTKCVATAVMRITGSSGRSRDTVWSMAASSCFKEPILAHMSVVHVANLICAACWRCSHRAGTG